MIKKSLMIKLSFFVKKNPNLTERIANSMGNVLKYLNT